jgi:hypothetical protein
MSPLVAIYREAVATGRWDALDAAASRAIALGLEPGHSHEEAWRLYMASAMEQRDFPELIARYNAAAQAGIVDWLTPGGEIAQWQGDWHRAGQFMRAQYAAMFQQNMGFPLPYAQWDLTLDGFSDKNVLLGGTAGYGDVFMFERFLPEIVRRAASLTVRCQPAHRELYRSYTDQIRTEPSQFVPGEFDMIAWGFELVALGPQPVHHTPLATDEHRAKARACLGHSDVPTVGICWTGGTVTGGESYSNVWNRPYVVTRPIDVASLEPIFDLARSSQIRLVSLMPESRGKLGDLPVLDLGEIMTDWAMTEAVLEQCDHVVSSDTAIANLAGIMEMPVSVLVPWISAYRWGKWDERHSPWFPTAKIYRQPWTGCWWMPVAELTADLRRMAAGSQRIAA